MSKIKVKEHENLSDANIKKVIELLEAEKPITKKDAYAILNISPNPARLNKIIENYKQEQEESARKRAANRGKPATAFETQTIIESFLDGESVAEIGKRLYRPPSFVKEVIEQVGVPQPVVGGTFWSAGLVPEQCQSETFDFGQIVWHSRRHCMAIILDEQLNRSDKSYKYYKVFVIEPIEEESPYFPQYQGYGGFFDGAYAYDLANLDHLKNYGVDIYRPYRPHFKKWLAGK